MLQDTLNWLIQSATTIAIRLAIAVVLIVVGFKLVDKIAQAVTNSKKMQGVDKTARVFIANFVSIGLKIVLAVIAISVMGINMTSVVALLTTAAAAIGLALQGGLSNIAGGIIILIFKPFKVGDFVISCGESGTVSEINMFYTILKTPDNKTISIPNGSISNSTMQNLSQENLRRVDINVTVDFDENVEGVQMLLQKIAETNELVLTDPAAPVAYITGYNERGIDVSLRAWVKGEDYWTVYFALNNAIKAGFEQYDVKFALPKVEVHND
jgi:small conductance mechanosensitive channel